MFKTTLKIEGMACGMCEAHINDCIRKNFAIKKIKTSHTKGESEIISDFSLDENKLKSVIESTGYVLNAVHAEPYQKKGVFGK